MQAQNDFDHQSAAMLINERLKKRPGHFGDMIRLQKIHMKLGHYREALQILEKLTHAPAVLGDPGQAAMIRQEIAIAEQHIRAETARERLRDGAPLEQSTQEIFFGDLLKSLHRAVQSWPMENGNSGYRIVPRDEKDALLKTLTTCREALQQSNMLPTGKPSHRNLCSIIANVRDGCIGNGHLEGLMRDTVDGMPGKVIIKASQIKIFAQSPDESAPQPPWPAPTETTSVETAPPAEKIPPQPQTVQFGRFLEVLITTAQNTWSTAGNSGVKNGYCKIPDDEKTTLVTILRTFQSTLQNGDLAKSRPQTMRELQQIITDADKGQINLGSLPLFIRKTEGSTSAIQINIAEAGCH